MGDNTMDFSKRCRLCIEPKRLSIDIFSEEGRRIKLKSKINKHLSVKVSQSDGLPSQICYQCLYRLETWVSFKQLCMERDQVMKTWSQSYMDETSCEVEGTFNGGQSYCKGSNERETESSRPLRLRSTSRDVDSNKETFAAGMQMDDAVSETSLWEVVKMDDGDTLECERQEGDIVHNDLSSHDSPDNCTMERDSSDQKHDWNRRKARKPSKTPSTGSDSSNSIDIDQDISAQSLNNIPTSSLSKPNCNKQFSSPQNSDLTEISPPPLKRKRGRPSKAFLQRERELKRNKEQETMNINTTPSSAQDHVVEKAPTAIDKDEVKDEELSETEFVPTIRSHVATPDFTPVIRDDGSCVTEVVLDDPDFGSMKFTLSVVEVESPISSPIAHEDYKYYPESCASSCGNLCSDSSNREDFEGFESSSNSALIKSMHRVGTNLQADEIPRSKSQADIRFPSCEDILPAGIKRKRSNSASGDFRVNCSASGYFSDDDQEELLVDNVVTEAGAQKMRCISKSFESLDECLREKPSHEALEERNAYSDGEISESPNKRQRKKSLLAQES